MDTFVVVAYHEERAAVLTAPEGPLKAPEGRSGPAHGATTVEQGRFCLARCTCGWRGPARRARSLARTDAEGHVRGAA
ncbi:hypothetical protein STXM2123_5706 [Streptomyces sp. F-3]|nr:hypothetical protein STXM2123_5706 [Streptomyces sp. F-3]